MISLSYVLLAVGGWVLYEYYTFAATRRKLASIPTIGSDTFILAYLSAWKFLSSGRSLMQEGYERYPNGVFKVATLETGSRWLVVVNTRKLISEIQLARDDVLSSIEFSDDMIQGQYTIGKKERFSHNGFEADLIRNNLMKGLPAWLPDIIEEIAQSFQDYLPPSEDWTPYTVEHTVVPIVNRTINLMLVDKPLCRDPEFLKIQQNFGMYVMLAAAITNITPGPFKKIAGYFACTVPRTVAKLNQFLADKIESRIRMKAEQGKEWDPSPNDFLSQLLDASPADCKNVYDMIVSVIVVNFAAIHTTSITASNVLIELALRPEYIEPLRKEIQDVVEAEGWTKEALDRMYKLDSFIKEIGRWKGIACTSVNRKAVKDFAFSNGVVLPAGVSVCAPSASVHLDPNVYENGPEFKGFRFSDKAKQEVKDQLTSPSPDFMLWGLGKHSCPGRWFAAVTIKCIIAHILINYDIKASDDPYPPPMWVGIQQIPDTKSKILFRKRQ